MLRRNVGVVAVMLVSSSTVAFQSDAPLFPAPLPRDPAFPDMTASVPLVYPQLGASGLMMGFGNRFSVNPLLSGRGSLLGGLRSSSRARSRGFRSVSELLAESSGSAPIRRVLGNAVIMPQMGRTRSSPPLAQPTVENDMIPNPTGVAPANAAPILTPSAFARATLSKTYDSTRQEGIEHFRRGEYREAMISFETALTLNAGDPLSRLGKVLCETRIGRYLPAVERLRAWRVRSNDDVFHSEIQTLFSSTDRLAAERERTRLGGWTAPPGSEEDAAGLAILLRWYDGQPEEARSLSEALKAKSPGSYYARWVLPVQQAGLPGVGGESAQDESRGSGSQPARGKNNESGGAPAAVPPK